MNKINKENDIPNEDRFQINKIVKVKRIKIGMVIAVIAGTLFIASQSLSTINQNWYTASYQRILIDYENGKLTYEELGDKRDQLTLNFITNTLNLSILSTIAKIGVYIAFIFIIIFLISIVLDVSFNRKMRRLALGLSVIILISILYPIFFAPGSILYYYLP